MSQLLSFSSLLRRLQHWAADAVAHRQPVKHSFFCTPALFCLLTPFFLQSQSPFSISIRRHPSAKCMSAFSCYPSTTVSALRHTEAAAAAAALRWKALDAATRPWTWCFYVTTPLNVKLGQLWNCSSSTTALHLLQSSLATSSNNTHLGSQLLPVHEDQRDLMEHPQKWSLQVDKTDAWVTR